MSGGGRLSALIHVFSRLGDRELGWLYSCGLKDHQNTTCEHAGIVEV